MKHIYWPLLILLLSSTALAQTGSLRGQVTDQNGAVVASAKVTVNGPSGLVKTTNTDKSGSYSFVGLPAGDYEVQAFAPNLELAEPVKVSFKGGTQTLDLQLRVVLATEKVKNKDLMKLTQSRITYNDLFLRRAFAETQSGEPLD